MVSGQVFPSETSLNKTNEVGSIFPVTSAALPALAIKSLKSVYAGCSEMSQIAVKLPGQVIVGRSASMVIVKLVSSEQTEGGTPSSLFALKVCVPFTL